MILPQQESRSRFQMLRHTTASPSTSPPAPLPPASAVFLTALEVQLLFAPRDSRAHWVSVDDVAWCKEFPPALSWVQPKGKQCDMPANYLYMGEGEPKKRVGGGSGTQKAGYDDN